MTQPVLPRKVMIVDDSEIVLALAAHTLEGAGYRVITHPHPAGCLALILKESPDLLLIDVNMPGLNGDTVVKMVVSAQPRSSMVVLLHSTLPADILAQKAEASGAHGFIRKTDSSLELVRQVARWLKPGASSGTHTISSSGRAESAKAAGNEPPKTTVNEPPSAPPESQKKIGSPPRTTILLVDHEMVQLSEYRRLVMSEPSQLEFALSGTEVMRKLSSDSPPDIVVLGRLVGTPDCEDVLREASRSAHRSRTRFILVCDAVEAVSPRALGATVLRRPLTEATLCGAIRQCQRRAS